VFRFSDSRDGKDLEIGINAIANEYLYLTIMVALKCKSQRQKRKHNGLVRLLHFKSYFENELA